MRTTIEIKPEHRAKLLELAAHRGQKGFPVPTPYVLAVVELAEGPRMMTTLVDVEPTSVRIGMPVEVMFRDVSDTIALPLFRPGHAS